MSLERCRPLLITCTMLAGMGAGCRLMGPKSELYSPKDVATQFVPHLFDVAEDIPPADPPPIENRVFRRSPSAEEDWNLSLRDAVATGLQQSMIVRSLEGNAVGPTGVSTFDPEISQAQRDIALTAFDSYISLGYTGNRYNQPPGTFFGPGIPNAARRDDGTFLASVVKPWDTGLQTRIAYNPPTGYLFLPNGTSGLFNPKYTSNTELSLRQPLLRGAGTDVNRAPLRIAQLRADQSIWDVKQGTLALVRSIEEAYWGLRAALEEVHALQEVVPLMDEVVGIQNHRLESERTVLADVAKARVQQAAFKQQLSAAWSSALEKELQLRNLLGLPPADGRRINPTDDPQRAPLIINPAATLLTALDHRPDLVRQRLNIRIREIELLVANNALKPQLDAVALYRTNGLSENLGDSLGMMTRNQYTDWTLGMYYSVPLGNRAAKAGVVAAELMFQREMAQLRQGLHSTSHRLSDLIRQLDAAHAQYLEAQIRADASEDWLRGAKIRYEDPPPGVDGQDWKLVALNEYLQALRARAEGVSDSAQLLSGYNTLLARLDESQGTLLQKYEVRLDGDPISQVPNLKDTDTLADLVRNVLPTQSNSATFQERPRTAALPYQSYRAR